MSDEPAKNLNPTFAGQIGAKAARKLKARRDSPESVLSGLGAMGIIGWSVVVPTLIGAATGIWLDRQFAGTHFWTLALLAAGLTIGCFNAWSWISHQDKAMRELQEDGDE